LGTIEDLVIEPINQLLFGEDDYVTCKDLYEALSLPGKNLLVFDGCQTQNFVQDAQELPPGTALIGVTRDAMEYEVNKVWGFMGELTYNFIKVIEQQEHRISAKEVVKEVNRRINEKTDTPFLQRYLFHKIDYDGTDIILPSKLKRLAAFMR